MWFAVDTLEFLKRGGRIGAASAWIGSTLKVKPILTVETEMTPVERVRTSKRMFERMVDYARQRHESGADAWVVQHIAAPGGGRRAGERCREIFGCDPLFVSEIGPVLSAHTGPGLLGVGSISERFLTADGRACTGPRRWSVLGDDHRLRRAGAVPDLPAAQADRLAAGGAFLAIALSGPVNVLSRKMRRGFAITLVYLGLLLIPFVLAALIVPPLVDRGQQPRRQRPAVRAAT